MIRYARFASPLGTILATAADGALTSINFVDAKYTPVIGGDWIEDPASPPLRECARQLGEFFAGERGAFDLALAPVGTPFQKRVWQEIARVPYGETITYAQLAQRAGSAGSARAAGSATGRNPIAIAIPCHRIVGTDGSLTGYAGGLERKTKLLELEGVLQGALV
jgi:methylated-DNA-[protein]-cysteine S-methyltransferase